MRRGILLGLGIAMLGTPLFGQDLRPIPRPGSVPVEVAVDTPADTPADAPEPTAAVLTSILPSPRPPDLMQGFEMKLALAAARNGDWETAGRLAANDSAVAADIIEWQRLRAGNGSFAEYRLFLARNGDWPGLDLLQKRGEASIPVGSAAVHVIAYFAESPPQTGYGTLRLAEALAASGDSARSRATLVRAWQTLDMSAEDEAAILAAHEKIVKPHHTARLDHALWQEDIAAARRMLPLVDDGWRALATARLALQRGAASVDALIEAVPAQLAKDPGLAHDRMNWQVSKRRRDTAADMIIARSSSAAALGRPAHWANWRRVLARQEMRAGNGKRAYALASNHHLEPGSDYADLEWLSGYLALRYLKKPDVALTHFRRFRTAVFTPISLGRAGYWEGRALDELGQSEAAQKAYADAARQQTSFYGLLAAEKAGVPMDPVLTGKDGIIPWRGTGFSRSTVFKAAGLFFQAGQNWETARFLRHLCETTDKDELVALSDYALSLGDPYLAVRVAKQIAQRGVVAPRAYYPMPSLGEGNLPVAEELALSIARRESEFHAAAVSGAGARGLMQLMPGTAKQMAGKLGVTYQKSRLTSDPAYNAALGSAYLAHLTEEFGNNIVLIAVGYNAGPHRARSWIEARGDPRDMDVDVVDWIEHIPFRETRNYVMRVAESLPVYRARLSGKVQPPGLLAELSAR
ncbi:MAG: lytic transglycosylase domain-containing protein [Rhodobacter sp.]|nr:lytic transglycosylase domain-containing protein [Rhodobacter sp.]